MKTLPVVQKEYAVVYYNPKGHYHSDSVIAWYYSSHHAEKRAAALVAEGYNAVVRSRRYIK